MKNHLVMCFTIILICGIAQIAGAQGGGPAFGGPPMNPGSGYPMRPGMQPMMRASGTLAATTPPAGMILTGPWSPLKLTDDQKQKIMTSQEEYRKSLANATKALTEANKELRKVLATKGTDKKVIKEKIKASRKAEDEVIAVNLAQWAKLRNILTEDQLKQLSQAETARPRFMPGEGTNDGPGMGMPPVGGGGMPPQ